MPLLEILAAGLAGLRRLLPRVIIVGLALGVLFAAEETIAAINGAVLRLGP